MVVGRVALDDDSPSEPEAGWRGVWGVGTWGAWVVARTCGFCAVARVGEVWPEEEMELVATAVEFCVRLMRSRTRKNCGSFSLTLPQAAARSGSDEVVMSRSSLMMPSHWLRSRSQS